MNPQPDLHRDAEWYPPHGWSPTSPQNTATTHKTVQENAPQTTTRPVSHDSRSNHDDVLMSRHLLFVSVELGVEPGFRHPENVTVGVMAKESVAAGSDHPVVKLVW